MIRDLGRQKEKLSPTRKLKNLPTKTLTFRSISGEGRGHQTKSPVHREIEKKRAPISWGGGSKRPSASGFIKQNAHRLGG